MKFPAKAIAFLRERPMLVAVLMALAFLPLKLWGSELAWVPAEAARDWQRGMDLWRLDGFTAHGPEFLLAGATPGWFHWLLVGLPHALGPWAHGGAMWPGLLFCAAIFFFHDAAQRLFGLRAALLATLLLGSFPLGTIALRYPWAPSHVFVFTALAFWALARGLLDGRRCWFAVALVSLLLGAQVHVGVWAIAAAFLLGGSATGALPSRRGWLAIGAAGLAFLGSWALAMSARGWPTAGSWQHAAEHPALDLFRLGANPNLLNALAMQFVIQPPIVSSTNFVSFPNSHLFSYVENLHSFSGIGRRLSIVAFVLSLAIPLLAGVGAVGALRRWGDGPQRRFLATALLTIALVSLVCLIWNPRSSYDPRAPFPLPLHWLFPLWPAQFFLVAAGLAALGQKPWRAPVGFIALNAAGFSAWLVVAFHLHVSMNGEPFQYTVVRDWSVHSIRDKQALVRALVARHGMTEEDLRERSHTRGELFRHTGESPLFELREAISRGGSRDHVSPLNGRRHYLFYRRSSPSTLPEGAGTEVDRIEVGSLGVVVYVPRVEAGPLPYRAPLGPWEE